MSSAFFPEASQVGAPVTISAPRIAVEGSVVLRPCQTEVGCVNQDQKDRCAELAAALTLNEVAAQVCPIEVVEGASYAA